MIKKIITTATLTIYILSSSQCIPTTNATTTTTTATTATATILPIIGSCTKDTDCYPKVRSRAPSPANIQAGVGVCKCYAASTIAPFDECEGRDDANCLMAKCPNNCEGYEAYCNVDDDESGGGGGVCALRLESSSSSSLEDGSNSDAATLVRNEQKNGDSEEEVAVVSSSSLASRSSTQHQFNLLAGIVVGLFQWSVLMK